MLGTQQLARGQARECLHALRLKIPAVHESGAAAGRSPRLSGRPGCWRAQDRHARGTGIFGEFTPTADISALTTAKVFTPGTKTPVFVRFSTVMGYRGSPEQARDPRGFAVKFYTQQGNWDVVGINWPIFFIRDAIKFPDFVHANKPSAVTGVQDPNLAFDFFAHTPEATNMICPGWQ